MKRIKFKRTVFPHSKIFEDTNNRRIIIKWDNNGVIQHISIPSEYKLLLETDEEVTVERKGE